MSLFQNIYAWLNKAIHKWILLEKDPAIITRSLVLGVFIGMTIPIGFQVIVCVPLAVIASSNVTIMIAATLVSNPLTVLPIYYTAMLIGEFFTGSSIPWQAIVDGINDMSIDRWMSLGSDIIYVLGTGVLIQAVAASLLTYLIARPLLGRYFSGNPSAALGERKAGNEY
ncbi:MAG: DUF2062 domain-containing protein [Calditrichota bacterium]